MVLGNALVVGMNIFVFVFSTNTNFAQVIAIELTQYTKHTISNNNSFMTSETTNEMCKLIMYVPDY